MSRRIRLAAAMAIFPGRTLSLGLYDESFEKDGCGIGLVARPDGLATRQIVESALQILKRLEHRGAVGADAKTSDGSGLLVSLPKDFFRAVVSELRTESDFAVGQVFSPHGKSSAVQREFEKHAVKFGFYVLATREVPTDLKVLGAQALLMRPEVTQVFLVPMDAATKASTTALIELRRSIELERDRHGLYICSLSYDTVVYKGLLAPGDLAAYFTDLADPRFRAAYAVVHSRFSTNTLPAWELAHPFRWISHNGEINTLRGNLSWMKSRVGPSDRSTPGGIPKGLSDSASLDYAVEILLASGRSLPEALMILIPQAWENDLSLDPHVRDFYRYHAARMEPWDGPAAVCFADSRYVGAALDRSGLRPCRYWILNDGTLVLASEVGALDVPSERIATRGRLGPGQMIAVDLLQKKILLNDDLKNPIAHQKNYDSLIENESRNLEDFVHSRTSEKPPTKPFDLFYELARFGVSDEEVRMVLRPMFDTGEEPTSSMGNDTPLAILSERPQLLYKYFRQLFAQVTNPPIDPIREAFVMSLTTRLGAKPSLAANFSSRYYLRLTQPILNRDAFQKIQAVGLKTNLETVQFRDLEIEYALETLKARACELARDGTEILILSDRTISNGFIAIPMLLAVASVHHALLREGLRSKLSIVVESGEPRDAHHVACLIGYGAEVIHPYVTLAVAEHFDPSGKSAANFIAAMGNGLLTILSKMGIACLQSYCAAQIFEIIGLSADVVENSFTGTPSRLGGLGYLEIAREARLRHQIAQDFIRDHPQALGLRSAGEIHYRQDGEKHVWNPTTIATLQNATRSNDPKTYAEFVVASEEASKGSLRGLIKLIPAGPRIPLGEVESAASIVTRFTTGAMSFGSLGQEAHEALAIAMNRIGGKSNSGEGGESATRFATLANGDRKISKIKQVASARFGVTAHYLVNAVELQIKVAQGAKPGEGGKLPGYKVDVNIAKLRHSTAGVTLISPPPHHDIYSIEDLAQLIFDLRRANPVARISVKLVAAAGIGTIAAGVVKAGADKILVSGDGGGTGASPLSSIKYAGCPWELGLAEVQQTLVIHGLRSRVLLEADGQMRTGRDVLIAACLGAEEFGFSTAPLIVEGCIMMRKCHLNTCPIGVATQDPKLRAKFSGLPEYLVNYFFFIANEVRGLLSELGLRSLDEATGRVECLEQIESTHWKSRTLDLTRLLVKTECAVPGVETGRRRIAPQKIRGDALNDPLLAAATRAVEQGSKFDFDFKISNEDRAVGTSISSLIAQHHGALGLPPDTITLRAEGVAGQSFGAFLSSGLTLRLTGEANDYVGKGISGGRLIVAPKNPMSKLAGSILAGNACFYGATSGEAFLAGSAGERFAVRNSGACIVVEGTGDHGCEYMTGGTVVVLGPTGRNFGAGMSGGQVFVFDADGLFSTRLGPAELEVRPVSLGPELTSEERQLKNRIEAHRNETGSPVANRILENWSTMRLKFLILIPLEYKKALAKFNAAATEVAFV